MKNDLRDEPLTPESRERLLVGKAKAQEMIRARVRNDVAELDEYGAFACLNDLIIMHAGYYEGRWPGSALELIPVILQSLEDDDDEDETA